MCIYNGVDHLENGHAGIGIFAIKARCGNDIGIAFFVHERERETDSRDLSDVVFLFFFYADVTFFLGEQFLSFRAFLSLCVLYDLAERRVYARISLFLLLSYEKVYSIYKCIYIHTFGIYKFDEGIGIYCDRIGCIL